MNRRDAFQQDQDFYVEEDAGEFAVFGDSSGFCYYTGGKHEADRQCAELRASKTASKKRESAETVVNNLLEDKGDDRFPSGISSLLAKKRLTWAEMGELRTELRNLRHERSELDAILKGGEKDQGHSKRISEIDALIGELNKGLSISQ